MVTLIASRRLNREWRQVLTNHDPANQTGYLSGETQAHSEVMTCMRISVNVTAHFANNVTDASVRLRGV